MKTETMIWKGADGMPLSGCIWQPDIAPRAVLQIAHGMTEHIGRYEKLAQDLTDCGIVVAGFDLRGHGHNAGTPDCASFGEGGWEASLRDMRLFRQELEMRFQGIPYFMLGFSLGSFLLRDYLSRYDDRIAGAAILGTGHQPGAVLSVMLWIVKREIRTHGFDNATPLVDKMSFENYNQKFAPNTTPYDWLCADAAERAAYEADPLCRKHISAGLFNQLIDAMRRTGKQSAFRKWNRITPVLLLSGQEDPVGDFGKGILRVKKGMDKAGLKDVEMHLIPGARHDLLHEEESGAAKKTVDILIKWIFKKL